MSFKFQLPSLNDTMSNQQLRSYLTQMTEQLEYVLNNLETSNFTEDTKDQVITKPEKQTQQNLDEAVSILKDMIIKNAEIIESHMDEISQELHGDYTALSSEFGEYKQESTAQITANAENITAQYTTIQTIQGDITTLDTNTTNSINTINNTLGDDATWMQQTDSYIKTGILYFEGLNAVTGIALGQIQTEIVNGEKVMKREGFYATFTPQELAFYKGTTKVAYVSNEQLYITDANIINGLNLGRYGIQDESGKGLTFKWKGN